MKRLRLFAMLFIFSLLTGCGALGFAAPTPTLAPTDTPSPQPTASPTNTLEPTMTFTPEPTLPPTIMPTIEPMLGMARTSITFRSQPRKGSDNVGGAYGHPTLKIIARNDAATWFYIIAPDTPGGVAWVLANAVELQGDITQLPIATFPNGQDAPPVLVLPLIYKISGTPLPLNTPAPGAPTGTVSQLAKVRVGPGVGYMDLGTLNPGDVVVITGRIKNNSWLQIEYPSGLDGRGWVLGELVANQSDLSGMQFYNLLATPVSKEEALGQVQAPDVTDTPSVEGTPADTAIPATPTVDRPYGTTLAQINARSGPAGSFQPYGLIDKDQRVNILGQTLNGLWFEIEYPSAPNGVAWVSSQYVKLASDITGLPYFNNDGTPLQKP